MANKLYVAELTGYAGIGSYIGPWVPNPIANQIVAVGGGSTQSTAFGARTKAILLVTDTACCIKIADDPTAVNTTDLLLPANVPLVIACSPGQKVACITP